MEILHQLDLLLHSGSLRASYDALEVAINKYGN